MIYCFQRSEQNDKCPSHDRSKKMSHSVLQLREKTCVAVTPSQVDFIVNPLSVNWRTTVRSFSPDFWAFCLLVIVSPSRTTSVLQVLPSADTSSNSPPILNLTSVVLAVVLVRTVQLPPVSLMVITGLDAIAAFLSNIPTPIAFSISS